MPNKKTLIYIPAYNAAQFLAQVLDRIPESVAARSSEVLIVDNASSDATYETASEYVCGTVGRKLRVIRNMHNLGYGGSQKVAYKYAIENGFDVVVMLHGDAQYAPEKLDAILEPCESDQADMVFGSRLAGDPLAGGMPLHRYWGNRFLTALANLALRWNLTEYHSGYRAYRVDALKRVPFERNADYYHFDMEILIQFRAARLRVVEIPIPTHYGDEKSYLNVWRTGFSILGVIAEYLLHVSRLKQTPKFEVQ